MIQVLEWDSKSDNSFESRIVDAWRFDFKAFQILEVILRQALLHPTVGYKFGFDRFDPSLCWSEGDTMEQFVGRIEQYLEKQTVEMQRRHNAACRLYEICPKPDGAIEFTPEYIRLQKEIGLISDDESSWQEFLKLHWSGDFEAPEFLLPYGLERLYFKKAHDDVFEVLSAKIKGAKSLAAPEQAKLTSNLKEKLKIKGRAPYKYITFDEEGIPQLTPERSEFFKEYITIAYSVFYPYVRRRFAKDGVEHDYNGFLSKKITHAFRDDLVFRNNRVPMNTAFSGRKLKDRIDHNQPFTDAKNKWLHQVGLVSTSLHKYLVEAF